MRAKLETFLEFYTTHTYIDNERILNWFVIVAVVVVSSECVCAFLKWCFVIFQMR